MASAILLAGTGQSQSTNNFELVPAMAFSSVRNLPACFATVPVGNQPAVGEIYLMSPDGTNVRQLTDNENCTHGDAFAALSGDGKKIVFDRLRLASDPLNPADQFLISNLFLMAADGTDQLLLIQGSSASWSPAVAENNHGAPESRRIVFHASASGTSLPIRPDPGAPTFDSDLFVLNVDDCLQYLSVQPAANCRDLATDITKDLQPGPMAPNYNGGQFTPLAAPAIEEDANWSPDGTKVVFTSHPAVFAFCTPPGTCNYPDTEIYTANPDGTGLTQLTHNNYEERAPAWSPDGSHIAYMCRIGPPNTTTGLATFEICIMDANGDGEGIKRLTSNGVLDATPSWSPDGTQIVFHRNPPPFQLWVVKTDTSCVQNLDGSISCSCPSGTYPPSGKCEMKLTNTLGVMNGFPDWGEVRVHIPNE
jgi:Tol biopolymer transport system component